MIDPFHHPIKFFFQTPIGANIVIALQQGVEGAVESLLGGLDLVRVVSRQAGLIVFFDPSDEIANRI